MTYRKPNDKIRIESHFVSVDYQSPNNGLNQNFKHVIDSLSKNRNSKPKKQADSPEAKSSRQRHSHNPTTFKLN